MRATELMLGDWVRVTEKARETYCYGEYKAGEIVQVREILDYGINPDWCGAEVNDVLHLEAIEPIPLTVEILKCNGFDLNGISEYLVPAEDRDFSDDTYVWQVGKFEDDTVVRVCVYFDYRYNDCIVELETPNITTDSIRLKYVHQLQHALRLCGIDKEIKLRKEE